MTTTPTLWRGPFTVNTTDAGQLGNGQYNSKVVGTGTGGFAVVWEDNTGISLFEANDIGGQVYDVLGTKVGTQFVASFIYSDLSQSAPALTALEDGGFAVAYQSEDAAGIGDGLNISVERYDGTGQFIDQDELRQAQPTQIDDTAPALVRLSGGASDLYFVAYEADDGQTQQIVGRPVDYSDPQQGSLGTLSAISDPTKQSSQVSLALIAQDTVGIVFREFDPVLQTTTIRLVVWNVTAAQAVDSVAIAQVANTAGDAPQITTLGESYAVVYADENVSPGIPGFYAYINTGITDFTISSATLAGGDPVFDPTILALADGSFVIAWRSNGAIGLQRFSATGAEIGDEVTVPSTWPLSEPSLSLLDDGRFVLSFTRDIMGNLDVRAVIYDPRDDEIAGTADADLITSRIDGAQIDAGGGSDIVHGRAGDDTFVGGAGNDLYYGSGGSDTVDYTPVADNLLIELRGAREGRTSINGVVKDTFWSVENATGGSGNDIIRGDGRNNDLQGGGGADLLVTGGGQDRLDGGAGSDTADYSGTSAGITVELNGATAVTLSLNGTASDTLLNIENIVGGKGNDVITGDGADNKLSGGAGIDSLQGGIGNDTLVGGDGDDLLQGGAGSDVLDGGRGIDTADFSDRGAGVVVRLRGSLESPVRVGGVDEDTIRGIENVIGSTGSDTIYGDGVANVIRGGLGNDVLYGKGGADIFIFDTTPGAGNVDEIRDFETGVDGIRLDAAVFDAIGTWDATRFASNAAGVATSGNTRIIFDNDSARGDLYYDADGDGAGTAVLIARLANLPALVWTDIDLIV